jgi:hypothetical protein
MPSDFGPILAASFKENDFSAAQLAGDVSRVWRKHGDNLASVDYASRHHERS